MSEQKPREWLIFHEKNQNFVNGPNLGAEVIKVIEHTAYEDLKKGALSICETLKGQLDDARKERDELKDTPGGKRIYACLNEVTKLRAELEERKKYDQPLADALTEAKNQLVKYEADLAVAMEALKAADGTFEQVDQHVGITQYYGGYRAWKLITDAIESNK